MQRLAARLLALFVTLALIGPVIPSGVAAQEATTVASPEAVTSPPPQAGAPIEDRGAACPRSEFPAGQQGITYQPLEDFGFVVPIDTPDHNLYLTVSTLPPGSCINFLGGLQGAATFFVLEGTMQVIVWSRTSTNIPVVKAGNEAGVAVTVPDGAPVTLDEGDWVTVDRQSSYAYRNPSSGEAKIVMAVYELFADQANGCHSGCRRHP